MSWQYKWCIEIKPAPAIIVLTGATGDLAKKKLFTAFEQLHTSGMWPEGSAVIGCGRRNWNDEDFRQYVQDSSGGKYSQMTLDSLFFAAGDVGEEQFAENLSAKISALLSRWQGAVPPALIFHFALAPGQTGTAVENLGRHGLFKESEQIPAVRAIFEKPFGFSGREAETLAAEHSNFLREDQIYRIDHYLGKDTIRNIMVTRFANRIFEPAWNSEHIEKIIIAAAEDVDVSARAAYYDKSGCIRDMFQNHLLEMLALTVMDRPDSPGLDSLTAAKTALLQKVQIKKVETAQYCGYTDTPGINADSKTETAACITLSIDTPRWKNTEFVLFSGKAMAERSTSIKIIFRSPASSIFPLVKADDFAGNVLAIEIQPEERMSLGIQVKRPGPNLCMGTAEMSFSYPAKDEKMNMDAYARLITEAMLGDRSTFVSLDMIKTGWSIFDPVLDSLQKSKQIPAVYPKGSAPEDIFRELLF